MSAAGRARIAAAARARWAKIKGKACAPPRATTTAKAKSVKAAPRQVGHEGRAKEKGRV